LITRRFPYRRLAPAAALGLALLTLAACGGSSGAGSSSSASTASSGSGGTSDSARSAASGSSGATLEATESDYRIALSSAAAHAGRVTISVRNAGQVTHDLVMDGPGVADQKTALLSPGQTAQLVVTLRAGTYDVYCDIPGHKQAGMDAKLTVS
jgi:uncharacterized cupredoxin-like copper-binding protein